MTVRFIDLVFICIISHCLKQMEISRPLHTDISNQCAPACPGLKKKRSISICCLYTLYMHDSSMKAVIVQWGSEATVTQWGNPKPVVKYHWINSRCSLHEGRIDEEQTAYTSQSCHFHLCVLLCVNRSKHQLWEYADKWAEEHAKQQPIKMTVQF